MAPSGSCRCTLLISTDQTVFPDVYFKYDNNGRLGDETLPDADVKDVFAAWGAQHLCSEWMPLKVSGALALNSKTEKSNLETTPDRYYLAG
jgi:hypothetical protein